VTEKALEETTDSRRRVLVEITFLWLLTNWLIWGVVRLHDGLQLNSAVLALVPCLFIYAPVLLCHLRGVDSYTYPLWVPRLTDGGAWGRALGRGAKWFLILLLPWLLAFHAYETLFLGAEFVFRLPPENWTKLLENVAYNIFYVAIAEEFFYRGYVQTRLNEVFPKRFQFGGITYGHSLWITSLFFAFGHSLVSVQWWHFSIFFPSLLFGLMRERTGGVVAAAFLHAFCNIGAYCVQAWYVAA